MRIGDASDEPHARRARSLHLRSTLIQTERANGSSGALQLEGQQLHVLDDSRELTRRQRKVRRDTFDVALFTGPKRVAIGHAALFRGAAAEVDDLIADDASAGSHLDACIEANVGPGFVE